ncbi:MAG: phenylalanine--tRNA ligase subunit beta [Desulfobacterales bacterium]|uniref:Phenylalanine--tRNA ligase beta subunit n=1 Tax=Candidatus Desulfaltia bathyphila TaxID=2841697 RepID=A0A8J6T6E8_9BACT|nr:phenylalanine--tRNA ligase subunit beta [Candidatus Desulfaltia bathyphila]MBL7195094.1 phenylalanine--tRNA ligase subunit beta [Desulfobacterales bacterium]MBL7207942.1 phenylalanine--tRNA ligase subunit beta [Desulfobacterales bacterium]
MKVSVSWLKDYISIDKNIDDLADALTMAGLEVESVSDRYSYLNSVVIGRIVEIKTHPDADKLKLCHVDIGNRVIPVVCGAPNAKNGILAPCALPGTVFPNGTILKKRSIIGEVSEGMLCSAVELGLGANSDGIMELKKNFAVGDKLHQALNLSDPVLEIDLTPNRPDCLSVIGTAREIAAFQKTKLTYPVISLPESPDSTGGVSDFSSVTIIDPDLCPRYSARLVFDIKIEPSPFWLQDRLISVGLKPINNIVDITNFVMMETGQPLHAFDFDRLAENRIVVRAAEEGEKFTTLDQKERLLTTRMLLICDGEKPVALAGVMGGLNSEIEQSTTRILLESAYFDPVCIRRTSKKTGLATDASHRFERGTDPNGTITALNRAVQLIAEICGGKIIHGIIDEYPKPVPERVITFSVDSTNRRLGTKLSQNDIKQYLCSIEFKVEKIDDDNLRVIPPSFRVDISTFEDLTEEIARLYGYNNIETTFPLIPAEAAEPSKKIDSRYHIKRLLVGFGFTETITYSFINKLSCDRLELKSDDPKRRLMNVLNPIAEDQSVLRTSLIPGLLETMHYNITMQNKDLKLFEIGNVFFNTGKEDSRPDEVEMLAGLWTGKRMEDSWLFREEHCDFYDIKGAVEELLRNLCITNIKFTRMLPENCCYTKPGYTAQLFVGNKSIGILGEVLPQVLKNYDLKQRAYIFELNADNIIELIPDIKSAKPLPKFPSISRDVTLIVDKDIEAFNIIKSVEVLNENLVESLHLFDVYEGSPIPAGKKSISLRITYRSAFETLEDETINSLHKDITGRLIKEFDAILPA